MYNEASDTPQFGQTFVGGVTDEIGTINTSELVCSEVIP
jgi:hypothetical protein